MVWVFQILQIQFSNELVIYLLTNEECYVQALVDH